MAPTPDSTPTPEDFQARPRPVGGQRGGRRPASGVSGGGPPVGGGPAAPRRVYTIPTESANPSIDAIMRQRPNYTGGGQIAKDGRRVRPRAFRSARKVRGQGETNAGVVRSRLRAYGYKLDDLRRVAQKTGRPSKVDSLLKDQLDLIIYKECREGFRKLSRKAVAVALDVTPNAVDKAYTRGERAMLNGARVEARLDKLERYVFGDVLSDASEYEPERPDFGELVESEMQVIGATGGAEQLRRADF